MATSRVARFCVGSEPLPICENPSAVVTAAAAVWPAIAWAMRSACAAMSARPRQSIRSVGHLAQRLRLVEEQARASPPGRPASVFPPARCGRTGSCGSAWTSGARPRIIPPWLAPISLSALAVIRSAPACTDSCKVGSLSKPKRETSTSGPAPTSSITRIPRSWAIRTNSASGTSAVKPEIL